MLSRNRFRNNLRSALVLAAGSASMGLVDQAWGTGGTWTYNGNENWSSGFAWINGGVANGANEVAGFGVGGVNVNILDTLLITLDTNRTIGGLEFGDGDAVNSPAGWRMTGPASALTLSAVGGPTINVAALGTGDGGSFPGTLFQRIVHIDTSLAGTQGFEKQGVGTLVLRGNNSGLSGPISLTQGILVLNHANALGTAATVTQRTGQLVFRGDASTNFGTDVIFQNDIVIGVGNAITTSGQYGIGAGQIHTIDEMTADSYGIRTIGVSGSNGYGLSMGRLTIREGVRVTNQGATGFILGAGDTNGVNGLGSGTLTIGSVNYSGPIAGTIEFGGVGSFAGNISITNGLTSTGGGSAALVYSGSKVMSVGTIGTGGDTYVTGGTTGTTAAGSYQAGVGTLIVGAGALPANRTVTINGGTVILGGGALTHSVNAVTMGGATLTTGPVPAHMDTGAGTLAIGSGGIVVNNSILFDAGNTVASANATAGGIAGRLDLGGSNRGVTVGGISTLTVGGIVSGTGGITKTGTGVLNLTNTNTFTGALDIVDGVVAGTVKGVGSNALGATGANVSLGGALRMNGIGTAGTGTVNTLTSKDSGVHSGFIVDASALGVTTLNINSYGGREASTHGTIKVVPVTGALNTSEIVNLSTGAPATTSGILPAYFAVQNSGTNTQLGFASLSGSRIVAFNSYQGGDINAASAVYDLASGSQTVGGAGKTLFAARIGANASVSGATLELGNGTTGFGGLILNGNALLGTSTLKPNGTDELVIWSGGTAANSITSNLNLTGDLTTGGSQALNISGTVNFNSPTRNLTVTGATVTLSNILALGTTGTFIKRGGGVLAVTGLNTTNTGTTTIQGGTLQLGAGASVGQLGSGSILNNANLSINNASTGSFANAVSGTGNLWVNATTTGIVTAQGALTYTGNTTVQSGTLRIDATDRLPTGTALRVDGGATFDLNGFGQNVSTLAGSGTITNGAISPQVIAVSSGTFNGSFRNGAGSVALTKNGPGLLVLTGGGSSFSGPVTVNGGTLQIDNGNALGIPNAAAITNGTLILNNAALILNNSTNRTINRPFSFTGISTISLTVNPNPQANVVLDNVGAAISGANSAGANASSNTGGWSGGGTLVLDLRGRQLDIGANNIANPGNGNGGNNVAATFANFTGTLMFSDANPAGSWTRWAGGVNGFATGNPLATFSFGSGYNNFSFRNGTIQMHLGYVSGGTNTILMGCENADNRTVNYNVGNLPGAQTFAGTFRDYDRQNGFFGVVSLTKVGSSSSLTLTGINDYSRPTTVNAGSLIIGAGGNIKGSTTINIANGATLAMLTGGTFGGTFGGSGQFVNITGKLDVTGAPGYSTPPSVTYTGGGTVHGNVNHNVGTMNPGTVGGFGTLTFNNNLSVSNSNFGFDVVSGLTNNLGGTASGTNDVLNVPTTNGLTINGGIVRLNFTGAGAASLNPGQYYPVVKFDGAIGGAGPSSLLAVALFKGSFLMVQGSGSLANTLGVQVVTPSAPASSITWKPTLADPTDTWDIGGAQNWVPNAGGGQTFYFNKEGITFDDTTTHRNVNVAPTFLEPSFLTITTNNVYTFSGAGTITGNTSLVKNGSGTLVMQTRNNFTGGTTINDGFILQDLLAGTGFVSLGSATIALNGDAGFGFTTPSPNAQFGPNAGTLVVNGNNTLAIPQNAQAQDVLLGILGGGTLTVVQPEHVGNSGGGPFLRGSMSSFTGTIVFGPRVDALKFQLSNEAEGSTTGNFGSPSAVFDMGNSNSTFSLGTNNRTFDLGGLAGQSGFVTGNEYNNTATWASVTASNTATISVGGANKHTTFGGQIVNANGGALTHFIKVGNSGSLTLTNAQPYTGNTLINGGTLVLQNESASPLSSPTIIIGTAGVLDVNGLSSGDGIFILNANQRIISNGDVVGSQLVAVSSSTIGGTQYNIPLFVSDGATISPGNSVGTLTVANMTLDGSVNFLVEVDQSGIDTLVLSGTQETAIVSGQSTLNLVNLGGFIPGTYTFLDYSGNPAIQGPIENGFIPLEFAYNVKVVHDSVNTKVNLVFVNDSAQWFVNNDGQWSTSTNWTLNGSTGSAVVPNAVTFGTFITAPRTVTVNSVIGNTANSIVFDNPQKYTIGGTGTLTLDSGAVVPITVVQGNHAINSPVRALKTLGVSVASGSTLSFGGTIINATNAGINKIGGGTASFTRLNMPGGTLNVGAGSVLMTIKPANNSVEGTNLLSNMTIAAGAKVDLTNNAMILDYTGAIGTRLTDLRAELQDGRLFSSTAGSNQTLGYRNNNTGTTPAGGGGTGGLGLGTGATFAGVATPDNTAVLIRVTYKGDSNLDGVVNVIDLYNMSLNWLSTNGVWAGGDFNYDGLVNQTDLGILSQNWQLGNNNPLPADDIGAALTAAGIPLSAVPEPGTLALAGVGAMGLLSRRRRRA